jgi:nicotinamidase-related amidase
MNRKALIVIDIQNDYFPSYEKAKWPLVGIEAAAANAARVMEASRAAGHLVINVRHEFPSTDAPFFHPGSDGAAIHPLASPKSGELVILKHHANAFRETNLKAVLDENGVSDVVIVGAMSHMCIDAATRAAADYGYTTTVVHDAVATRDLEMDGKVIAADQVHSAYMAALGFGYATLVSTDDFVASVDAPAAAQ